jgi:hypothetical protein
MENILGSRQSVCTDRGRSKVLKKQPNEPPRLHEAHERDDLGRRFVDQPGPASVFWGTATREPPNVL